MSETPAMPIQFREILANYSPRLSAISAEEYGKQPAPGKWSKKEIMGHLVDSAQNNLRRLIVGQYDAESVIAYRQDEWVKSSGYNEWPEDEIILLWQLLNSQMARVLENTAPSVLQNKILMPGGDRPTLEWIAADYLKHLLHHLHQVTGMDPVAYP